MSTGINIKDIKIVIQWKFTITRDIEDAMQRLGRAGRALERALAFLFMPYYIDDAIKDVPAGSREPTVVPRRRRHAPLRPSGLAQELPGEDVDGASDQDDLQSDAGLEAGDEGVGAGPVGAKKTWTKPELAAREKIPLIWREAWNDHHKMTGGLCFRKVVNRYLGEQKSLYPQDPPSKDDCCSMCNPNLYRDLDEPPKSSVKPVHAPRAGTRQACALPLLQEWCVKEANKLFDGPRMFDIPANFVMDERLQWSICDVYSPANSAKTSVDWRKLTAERLEAITPSVKDW